MTFLADLLLFSASLGAGLYCMVLSRRLKRLSGLETGMGGAIAVLSAQVDDLTRMLDRAREAAQGSGDRLEERTQRAETAARKLEIMLAALHDLPDGPDAVSGSSRLRFTRRKISPASETAS
ncbi:DUF6468 domain-containing protein [Albidovulum sp.]|uniref:DUF6468 domain-containing protein n=1 Tax=Albidovulum sp. TaxID=1872424 RepID=UPI002C5222E5|nr:hypothetical protein [Defluviimonas sp.]MCP5375697.1 hypothetical protein [Paracoccaceae bacterium]HRV62105.1 DUF6468 domain-containing protein [Albidovulum sp.]